MRRKIAPMVWLQRCAFKKCGVDLRRGAKHGTEKSKRCTWSEWYRDPNAKMKRSLKTRKRLTLPPLSTTFDTFVTIQFVFHCHHLAMRTTLWHPRGISKKLLECGERGKRRYFKQVLDIIERTNRRRSTQLVQRVSESFGQISWISNWRKRRLKAITKSTRYFTTI